MLYILVGFREFWAGREKCVKVTSINKPVTLSILSPVKPGFYPTNWLYLGKTYVQLGQTGKARDWLQKAADHTPKNQEDVDVSWGYM